MKGSWDKSDHETALFTKMYHISKAPTRSYLGHNGCPEGEKTLLNNNACKH